MKNICLFLFLLYSINAERSVKGVVMFDDMPMVGATVTITNNAQSTLTGDNGEFAFNLPGNINNIALEVYLDHHGVTTRVENISIAEGDTRLANIPLFIGKSITVKEYNALATAARKDYMPIYHNVQVVSYISKTKIDTTKVSHPCSGKIFKIPYRHEADGNKVVYDYKDLSVCQ
jgi:hypothetical protein